MPIVAEEYQFVIGVDTHAASHSFAVIAPATTAVGQEAQFPATAAGLSRAVAWAGRHAGSPDAVLVVVEGIGSYGAGVARAFMAAGYRVVEGGAQSAGDRRGTGKSDALDAVRIARSAIGTDTAQLREPRAEGIRNALRILIISREMMTRERTATVNALTDLVRTTDLGLDARKALTIGQLRVVAAWRIRAGDAIDVAVARAEATRLARHAMELGTHAAANARQLDGLVRQVAPDLLDKLGVGPVTAAVLVVSWSHHGRVRSEAATAGSTGQSTPSPSGAWPTTPTPRPTSPDASPMAKASAKPCDASSATSPAACTEHPKTHPPWPLDNHRSICELSASAWLVPYAPPGPGIVT